jgi:hypothetical protein
MKGIVHNYNCQIATKQRFNGYENVVFKNEMLV